MNDFGSDCLIVGAGPAGLTVACLLATYGIECSVIEARSSNDESFSRATGLRSGTLNILKFLGVLDEILVRSRSISGMRIYRSRQPVGFVEFAGTEHSPVNNISVEQPVLQEALLRLARDLRVKIYYDCELLQVEEYEHSVSAMMSRSGETLRREFRFLVGADGSRSPTRRQLGISFDGDVDSNLSFVADCVMRCDLSPNEMHYFVTEGEQRLAIIPLSTTEARFKLSGNLPDDFDNNASLAEIEARLRELVDKSLVGQTYLERVENFSPYRLANRLASRFSTQRCFLVGDAARICFPNGGWGLNSAIADATNLAWKLAGVVAGWCDVRVLGTYELERRATSKELLAFTKRQRRAAFSEMESKARSEETFSPVLRPDGQLILGNSAISDNSLPCVGSNVFDIWLPSLGHSLSGPIGGKFSIFTSDDCFTQNRRAAGLSASVAAAGVPIHEGIHVVPKGEQTEIATNNVVVVRPDGIVGATGSDVAACMTNYFNSFNSNSGLTNVAP